MSVFEARLAIESYLKNCVSERMREAAKADFVMAIQDTIKLGYTWGGSGHIMPLSLSRFDRRQLEELLRLLK